MTDDPLMDLISKGKYYPISHNGEKIPKGEKGKDNPYKLCEEKHKKHVLVFSVGDHTSDNTISDDDESKTDSIEGYEDNKPNSIKKWHHCLGHLSKTCLEHFARIGMLSILKKQSNMPLKCLRCAQGNSYSQAYKRRPKKCTI